MIDDNILWVTSYPARLEAISGIPLLLSFQGGGNIVAYTEGCTSRTDIQNPRVCYRRLDDDPILQEFLAANADIIPTDLGGRWSGPCSCPNPSDHHAKTHVLPCPGFWFCRHASRWFRKVLAMHRALTEPPRSGIRVFVWIDADCVFRRPCPMAAVFSWFNNTDVFFLKSRRKAPETGLFGLRGLGRQINVAMLDMYCTGRFRSEKRWDDAYIFGRVLEALPQIGRRDIARRVTSHGEVVPDSPAGWFLVHNKGSHGRVKGIFT